MNYCCDKCGMQLMPYDRTHDCIAAWKDAQLKLEKRCEELEAKIANQSKVFEELVVQHTALAELRDFWRNRFNKEQGE